jgi:hypothetical protein
VVGPRLMDASRRHCEQVILNHVSSLVLLPLEE